MLGEYAELDFIAGDIEESGVRMEELAKDWVRERAETRARDMHKREGYGEEADSDLHCPRSTCLIADKIKTAQMPLSPLSHVLRNQLEGTP